MTAQRSVEDKVADWLVVYQAVQSEFDSKLPGLRELAALAAPGDAGSINVGLTASRIICANDRAAATVAALLTQSGIKPTAIDYGEDET